MIGKALLSAVALILLTCDVGAGCQQPKPTASSLPPPSERLFVGVFSLGEDVAQVLAVQDKRLLNICQTYEPACWSEHFVPSRHLIASLHAAPDEASLITARLYAHVRIESGRLGIGLDLERPDAPGVFETWLSSVGDWFYGLYVSGIRPQGDWVQMFGPPFPSQAWLFAKTPSFEALVLPLEGEILFLKSVPAGNARSGRGMVAHGSYLIQKTSSTMVTFRAEVTSDMPCDGPVTPARTMPPTLRAAPADFFDAEGKPRFTYVYQKGC